MFHGELLKILTKSPKLKIGDVVLAFASGSSQHGARIEGKSDLDVAGVYIGPPEFELAHGYDCYVEDETEFLTDHGWKRFDNVLSTDRLAVFNPTGDSAGVSFEHALQRISKQHSGYVYVIEPQLTRCVVTPNHNMVVSPASRGRATGFSTEYKIEKAAWGLNSLADLMTGIKTRVTRSMYHIRRSVMPRIKPFPIEQEYLLLGGLFLSEGSISFRNGKVKSARLVQTPEGKQEYYMLADRLVKVLGGHRYDYPRKHVEFETIWTLPRIIAERLYTDFGHHKGKHLPEWAFHLSYDQAWELWNGACLGDGYHTKNERGSGQGTLLYTSVKKLADDIQAMMVSSGHICVVNGPYEYDRDASILNKFGNVPMYQIYRPNEQDRFRCVNFRSGILKSGEEPKNKYGYAVKELKTEDIRVVCFEVPSGTLVTRSQGKPAFHGNCKAAMHMLRAMDECLELLNTGMMTFPRPNVETLLEIRRGEWGLERVKSEYNRLREEIVLAEQTSPLPAQCDREAITKVVAEAMLHHWKTRGYLL